MLYDGGYLYRIRKRGEWGEHVASTVAAGKRGLERSELAENSHGHVIREATTVLGGELNEKCPVRSVEALEYGQEHRVIAILI